MLSFDVLRGIAALAVMATHLAISTHVTTGRLAPVPYGYLAVDLFFMMSGFVIGKVYEDKLLKGMSFRRFMLIRIARLYPCLALGCMIGLVAMPVYTKWEAAAQFLLIPSLASTALFPLNPVLWSLFYEIAINAGHAVAARHITLRRLIVFVVFSGAAFLLSAWIYGGPGIGWNGQSFLPGFARVGWGYGVGLLWFRVTRVRPELLRTVPFAVAPGLAAAFLFSPNLGVSWIQVPFTLFVGLPLITISAICSVCPRRGASVAAWLGLISYPLYTIHLPLLRLAQLQVPAFSFLWLGVTVAMLAIATAVEYLYDAPLRGLLKRLISRLPRLHGTQT